MARIGRFASGLAEIATRDSLSGVLVRNWSQVVFLLGVLLVGVGFLAGRPETTRAGWITIGAIVALRIVTWVFEELTGGGSKRRRLLLAAVIITALVALASTIWAAIELFS
jgi:hypothetical protein